MGNQRSKLQQNESQYNVTVSPVTPESKAECFSDDRNSQHVMALVDPRSPTVEISRTPITVEEKERREKMMRMILKVNNDDVEKSPNFPPGFDPRSPNCDIKRTPIMLENIDVAPEDASFSGEIQNSKRDLDTTATGQLCRDLRKRLFISQRLNMSDTMDNDDKEN